MTLLTTLYLQQAAADPAAEGATVMVDFSSATAIFDHFYVIVDRQ